MPSYSPFNKAIQILSPVFYQNCTEFPKRPPPCHTDICQVRIQGMVKCCVQRWASTLAYRSNARHRSNIRP